MNWDAIFGAALMQNADGGVRPQASTSGERGISVRLWP
jgi:hypothetical protein